MPSLPGNIARSAPNLYRLVDLLGVRLGRDWRKNLIKRIGERQAPKYGRDRSGGATAPSRARRRWRRCPLSPGDLGDACGVGSTTDSATIRPGGQLRRTLSWCRLRPIHRLLLLTMARARASLGLGLWPSGAGLTNRLPASSYWTGSAVSAPYRGFRDCGGTYWCRWAPRPQLAVARSMVPGQRSSAPGGVVSGGCATLPPTVVDAPATLDASDSAAATRPGAQRAARLGDRDPQPSQYLF